MLLAAVILLLITGVTWAHFAILDEVKRGQGRVVPSRQMQVLQSLEGGLIEEIAVREGDTVQKGQVLARINNTKFSSDLGEARAKRDAANNSLKLLTREVDLTRKLYEQKVVPEIEMLRLQRQAADLAGQIAVLEETIKSAEDRVRRTELRSPVYGIINKINVTTVGAVMKLTAYDSSVFGSLKGKVERISADTIIEDKSKTGDKPESFYRVMVRTDKNYLGSQESPLPIIPGMVATVEVLTGKKSVLDYLIKPARMLGEEALRER